MPVGRYCSLPGTSGAYAFAPLHGRPTAAPDVHSPPKCFPIAADTCQALLFSAMNMGGVCNTPLHGRPTMAPDVHSPPKCFPIAADTCRALLYPAGNIGGRMQYAPTRTSDNGRRRSFAPEMFSDTCARRSFASVRNHFTGHRVPFAGSVGAYCIRPFKWPRRGQIRRRRSTPIRL